MDEYEARKYRKAEKSGYKKGMKVGEANGIKIGEANGEVRGIRNTALRMMQSGSFTEAQIFEATGLTKEQLQALKTASEPQK